MNIYIINWFRNGDFSNTGESSFKSYAEAKEFAESIAEVGWHYDIVELKNSWREDGEPFKDYSEEEKTSRAIRQKEEKKPNHIRLSLDAEGNENCVLLLKWLQQKWNPRNRQCEVCDDNRWIVISEKAVVCHGCCNTKHFTFD